MTNSDAHGDPHHDHSHGHADGHSHAHVHAPTNFGPRFIIGIGLNIVIVVLELVYGLISHSVALIADAGHNLSDVLGLCVAYVAIMLAARPPSGRFTYGLKGSSILAALFNAMFLLVATGALSYEAIRRFFDPEPVAAGTMMAVAAIGMVINAATAALFVSGQGDDLNIRGAFLHMAADAAVSAGVVLAGLLILVTGQLWLDPLMSLVINAVIILGTWGLLRESVVMSLAAAPKGVAVGDVRGFLAGLPGVASVHDLHIWSMSTSEIALTGHLVTPGGHPGDAFLMDTAHHLNERFRICHVTLQIETDETTACALAPEEVV
ncbi:cation diffusion facilitator family transporter [Methylocella silvestris]|uniref:Cation transporter n=1 Tax=Methylocella silvestris TaxID=199596 RepID=A0A2J7TIV2_METSI|nr:cation diffusion facilitator family transporter [Methylocella silvestris]PNG26676.1 cation transporter [Methylocella silvestris]